jgi:hypothetical protein
MFMTLGVADLESFAERWEMHLHRRSERSPPQRRWSFLSLVPSILIRNLLFGALATPYIWIVGHPPFPYHDKPWYVSPAGALATAIAWEAAKDDMERTVRARGARLSAYDYQS